MAGRRILKLKITEVSAVDRPANNKSKITGMELVKREDAPDLSPELEMGVLRKLARMLIKGEPELVEHIEKVAQRKDVDEADKEHAKQQYGDVAFADEKNKRYPVDSEAHVRAALSYWGMPKNRAKYSTEDQAKIGAKIHAAANKLGIGEKADIADDVMKSLESEPFIELVDSEEDINKSQALISCAVELAEKLGELPTNELIAQVQSEFTAEIQKALTEGSEELDKNVADIAQILKDFEAGAGIFAKRESAPAPAPSAPATLNAETADALIKAIDAAALGYRIMKVDAEMEALAQGAHDAMAAAGAPPHHEYDDDMDAGEAAKCDAYIDLIKSANGIDDATREGMVGAFEKAKYSKATAANLEKAHSLIKSIGAKCEMPAMNKGIDMAALKKMLKESVAAAVEPLKKTIEEKDAQIAELAKQAAQPTQLPAGLQLRTVEKSGVMTGYLPAGTQMVTAAAAAAPQAPRPISDAAEFLPLVAKVHATQEPANGIEGLLH